MNQGGLLMRVHLPCVTTEQYEKEWSEPSAIYHSGDLHRDTAAAQLREDVFNKAVSQSKKICI